MLSLLDESHEVETFETAGEARSWLGLAAGDAG